MSETPIGDAVAEELDNPGELAAVPENGDDDAADETGLDDAGAAPVDDLPDGSVDETFDGSDTGDDGDDPGLALPDDPHNLAPEGE